MNFVEKLHLNNSVTPMKKQVLVVAAFENLSSSRTPLDVLYVDKLVTVKNDLVNFWYFCVSFVYFYFWDVEEFIPLKGSSKNSLSYCVMCSKHT